MPDPLLQPLFTDTEQLRPAPVAQVQARGRQRARRRRLAVLAATLVMGVPVGVAVTLGQPGRDDGDPAVVASTRPAPTAGPTADPTPTPTPTPAGTSSRPAGDPPASTDPGPAPTTGGSAPAPRNLTSVPATALLRADDLGGGGWTTNDEGTEGDWSLAATLGYCPAARQELAFYGEPRDKRVRQIGRGGPGPAVIQEVLLFRGGGAQRYHDYYRRGAEVCREHVAEGSRAEVTMTVVAQGFAGRRSILVRTGTPGHARLYGVVVHGDLATQFTVHDGSVATGRQLGATARNRLCRAAGTC